MTLVEIALFVLAGFGLYLIFRPLQRCLEDKFYQFFKTKTGKSGRVIDITDYTKKDHDHE